jgi:hypothetical protein
VLNNDAIPEELTAKGWPTAGIAGAAFTDATSNEALTPLTRDMQTFQRFDVFVFPGQAELAWDVLARLRKASKSYRVFFIDNERLEAERASQRYTFEDMYK